MNSYKVIILVVALIPFAFTACESKKEKATSLPVEIKNQEQFFDARIKLTDELVTILQKYSDGTISASDAEKRLEEFLEQTKEQRVALNAFPYAIGKAPPELKAREEEMHKTTGNMAELIYGLNDAKKMTPRVEALLQKY